MGDTTGFASRFPGNLDPRAQEFIPTTHHHLPPLLFPHLYVPYASPPPYHQFSPPAPPPPAFVSSDHPSLLSPPGSTSLPPSCNMPSRALLLSMVPADVSESTVRRELEVFGDVRAVQMERVRDGIVTVHFYDLRQAQEALAAIQEQHMQQQFRLRRHYDAVFAQNSVGLNLLPPPSQLLLPPLPPPARGLIAGRAVWAQYTVPVASTLPDGNNQGTLVIFNLEPEVTPTYLKQIFEAFGPVKELRETPMKRHQRFVEFHDTRDAAKALSEMNGKEIQGRQVVIEFSRPGGHSKKSSSSRASRGNTMATFSGLEYSLTNYQARPSRNLPPSPPPPMSRKIPGRPLCKSHDMKAASFYSKGNPNGNGDNRSSSSSNASVQNSMASLRLVGQNGSRNVGVQEESWNFRPSSSKKNCKKRGGNGTNIASGSSGTATSSSTSKHQQQQTKGSRPWKGSSRQSKEYDPRFLINEDAIIESNCPDSRTTVMIKNIPNKYSQKLLLNMLDNHCIHCNEQIDDGDDQPLSSYDFVYLPIDFINKCNVGYGFVNMTSPEATLRLYKAFHRQSWEVFNSRKICEVTYARLQGVEALKEHFKNSKFPCDVDEYMPVVFSPSRDGRRLTEPVPITGHSTASTPPLLLSSSPAASSKEDYHSEDYDEIDGGDSQVNGVNGDVINDDDVDGNDEDQEMYSCGGKSSTSRNGCSSSSSSNGGDSGDPCDDSDDVYGGRQKQ
ncbi:protein terminal ear1 homolog [Coffea arabica]|uniref:Protein terminal ear1 homolog n=1 Tax=Coffea arabica TaxID=13443 RepID=A0A6P6V9F1_COFAR|nr:protein terminal ear1-like [Coffea arabica]